MEIIALFFYVTSAALTRNVFLMDDQEKTLPRSELKAFTASARKGGKEERENKTSLSRKWTNSS